MSELLLSTSLSHGMGTKPARQRITSFTERFGQSHLYLAYHAAFPLALTPDLLYRLWANFPRNISHELLNIPWVAVADLLLSSLCSEVGYELYQMDVTIRNELLRDLKTHPNFGEKRITELANFLFTYIEQFNSVDPDVHDFVQSQRWTALAYTQPEKAATELASALALNVERNEKAEQLRIISLIASVAAPLVDANFAPLLIYARGMWFWAHGDSENANALFARVAGHGSSVSIQGIRLPIPVQVRREREEIQKDASLLLHLVLGAKSMEPEQLSNVIFPETPLPNTTDRMAVLHSYEIENIRISKPSSLIFVREKNTDERVVIKVLSEYKDKRFDLSTSDRRLRSQIEALRWNRKITPDVYLGLAPILSPVLDFVHPKTSIVLGEIIKDPVSEELDPSLDYALLMRRLPDKQQLDRLLKNSLPAFQQYYIRLVTRRVVDMHHNLEALVAVGDDKEYWGSYQQLQEKLNHNFQLAEELMLIKDSTHQDLVESLKMTLSDMLTLPSYQKYFEQRRNEGWIKRCHGDLKSQNIWIVSSDAEDDEEPSRHVKILDAIDFNPAYCHIDILSDFAMLVIDVQARTESFSLADMMIEQYLILTQQEEEVSRCILDYYLVEKALVRAMESITNDRLPELGAKFLQIAEKRLDILKRHLNTQSQH